MTERSPGVWRLRAFAGHDPVTKKPRQVSRTFRGNKTEAGKALRAFTSEVDAGQHRGAHMKVTNLLARWPEHLERIGRRPATLASYRTIIAKHLDPILGDIELRKLSSYDLDSYYTHQGRQGLAVGTIRLHHAILSGALAQAVKWDWIGKNPALNASPPTPVEVEKRRLTPDDVWLLVAAAGDNFDLATVVVLGAMTGARRGELCGLQWSDLDWDAGTLRVERQRYPTFGGDATGPTKSKPRDVVLDDQTLDWLRRYRAKVEERAASLGQVIPETGWLLSADYGVMPMRSKGVTQAMTALAEKAGMPGISTHALRHLNASEMMAASIDVVTAAARLGHTAEMLLRVYAHPIEERNRAAAGSLMARVYPKELPALKLGVLGPAPEGVTE